MKRANLAIAIGAAILAAYASAAMPQGKSDWVDITSAKELRALYSNTTFRGKDGWGNSFVGHYSADGKGILIVGELRYPRTWEVKDGNQVCVTEQRGTACYTFQRHHERPNQIKAHNVQQNTFVEFTVEKGAPKF